MDMDSSFKKRTKRLVLRPYHLDDYDVWRETFLNLNRPRNKWDQGPRDKKDLTKAKFKKILDTHKKNRENDIFYDLIAFEKKSGRIIGFSALMDVSRAIFQNAYLGYSILNLYWENGFGKEMVKSTLKIGFKDLQIHRIEAGIGLGNKRSIALVKSLGMRREGLSKRRLYLNNQWLDMVIYAMTAEEIGLRGHTGKIMGGRR